MKDYTVEDFNHDFNARLEILRPLKHIELADVLRQLKPDFKEIEMDMEISYGE